jgi:mannose-P-dolichol utilization defect protein 1
MLRFMGLLLAAHSAGAFAFSPTLRRSSVTVVRTSPDLLTAAAPPPPPPKAATGVLTTVVAAGMTAGAFAIYLPIISNIIVARSSLGLSQTTWAMNLLGVSGILAYNLHRGIPLSNYVEFFLLALQSLAINAMLQFYAGGTPLPTVLGAAAAYVGTIVGTCRILPAGLFAPLQAAATVVYTAALVPQVVSNFATRSGGGWSPITALLATLGNSARVVTTLRLAQKEPMVLLQFLWGAALNFCLLLQCLVWK